MKLWREMQALMIKARRKGWVSGYRIEWIGSNKVVVVMYLKDKA